MSSRRRYTGPVALRGKRLKFMALDGLIYVGLFDNQVQSSRGLLWRVTFANPNAPAALVFPRRCVETTDPLSDIGPLVDDRVRG
ncbi:hypothetical protein BV20DRAFT_972242 [Pilatotrama ljubarskyi]|nr:hypothetical protein BV20DRAFT_972242 [Pilatotrama ljubarskyi]